MWIDTSYLTYDAKYNCIDAKILDFCEWDDDFQGDIECPSGFNRRFIFQSQSDKLVILSGGIDTEYDSDELYELAWLIYTNQILMGKEIHLSYDDRGFVDSYHYDNSIVSQQEWDNLSSSYSQWIRNNDNNWV
jgi:hypothetical protein